MEVLERRPERLLGTDWTGHRTDHEAVLRPGDTLLLITDGLIEHGHRHIDEGTARLTAALPPLAGLAMDELCDRLLETIVAGRPDDDVAVLALRCHPGPQPEPPPGQELGRSVLSF